MPQVNPAVLKWARETAGYSLEAAADAIDLKTARGNSGAERLEALERGEGEPSRPLLQRMANKYRRPLVTFYLGVVPAKGDRGEDFRTLVGTAPSGEEPLLDALVRDIRARHSLVKSILEDEESERLGFVGSTSIAVGADAVAVDICKRIGFQRSVFRSKSDVDSAFAYLRGALEQAGVFVLLIGNLGSHHSNISASTFRGFAIADPLAPFIVINDQDARAAWAFTALHEAVHLWIGKTGISGPSLRTEGAVERFCNDVAGRILLPKNELGELVGLRELHDAVQRISAFAKERNISRRMVAYHLLREDIIDGALWSALNDTFHNDYLASKAKSKDADKKGGVSFYVVRRHRLGPALVGLVDRALSQGSLSFTKASVVLGVKPSTVAPLLRGQAPGGA